MKTIKRLRHHKSITLFSRLRMRLIGFLLIFSLSSVLAQQSQVNGVVKDENGETVIGATVLLKGTKNATITDVNGKFSLKTAANGTLVVTYLGYERMELPLGGKTNLIVKLKPATTNLDEVVVVAYGTSRKETLTGAISSVKTDQILRSPNANIINALSGSMPGVSTVAMSGQPGKEDTKIFVRGIGSLTEGASTPLILVDGVERSFSDMDPNEIENVTVLRDASATAVFGVRGANGVILVTTRRGEEGKPRISVNSSVGVQQYTRVLDMVDSYTFAQRRNEMSDNDNAVRVFDDYTVDRFRLGDEPIMYPNFDLRKYAMKEAAMQTQHNLNISGGTKRLRYFISAGYLFQDGLFRDFKNLDYDNNYQYNRFNYRSNLDFQISKSTQLKMGIGGIVGVTHEPFVAGAPSMMQQLLWSYPFVSPGIVDGKFISVDVSTRYPGIYPSNGLLSYYDRGFSDTSNNTMNLDMTFTQGLDVITKGLSLEVKGAYNSGYSYKKERRKDAETYTVYYKSALDGSGLKPSDENYDKELVYRIKGKTTPYMFAENTTRSRDWYVEGSLRYNRKFGRHTVSALALYNQTKKYYPKQLVEIPTAYLGFVGRVTYDYLSKYLVEFNVGRNGSENFAPGQRYGTFPALSVGYVLTQEEFMKKQSFIQHLKLRASAGLVGNDNIQNNRYLYLPNSYGVGRTEFNLNNGNRYGYNFGYNSPYITPSSLENRLGNPNVTWETAFKQNYGLDIAILNNKLNVSVDAFVEKRKDILINRNTVPSYTGLSKENLPVVNMGKVENKGFEVLLKWNDGRKNWRYWVEANLSYAKNKIIFKDEVNPPEPYMRETGNQVGAYYGYVFDRFYAQDDFENGKLKPSFPSAGLDVKPGDVKYKDLNNDNVITPSDVKRVGYSSNPNLVCGLNFGGNYKGFFASMSWVGAAQRSLVLEGTFRNPFDGGTRSLMQFQADSRWTPETAATATMPRLTVTNAVYNTYQSSLWERDGSYIKLKNISVGYSFTNVPALRKIGITQLDVKITGYNLLTFDKFKIMDPESTPKYGSSDGNGGELYPIIKIYNIGVNLTF